jgi:hypothetical protein
VVKIGTQIFHERQKVPIPIADALTTGHEWQLYRSFWGKKYRVIEKKFATYVPKIAEYPGAGTALHIIESNDGHAAAPLDDPAPTGSIKAASGGCRIILTVSDQAFPLPSPLRKRMAPL